MIIMIQNFNDSKQMSDIIKPIWTIGRSVCSSYSISLKIVQQVKKVQEIAYFFLIYSKSSRSAEHGRAYVRDSSLCASSLHLFLGYLHFPSGITVDLALLRSDLHILNQKRKLLLRRFDCIFCLSFTVLSLFVELRSAFSPARRFRCRIKHVLSHLFILNYS